MDSLLNDLTSPFSEVPASVSFLRIVSAVILAALIGAERERQEKPAGLRTHILVSVAACLFVILGQELAALDFGGDAKRVDPLRMIEAVTAGVAFLAAGLIFTSNGQVQNVTTGTSLWLAGAVGLGCGAGQLALAAMATGVVIFVLLLLRKLEKLMGTH
ncbi:MAG: MgtC/SapB family protein [Pelagibaca sp.]